MRTAAGFTLLELSVVLALMALMAGVVTVSMNGRLRGAHEDQALHAIRSLDQRARHEARTGLAGVTLQLDTPHRRIRVVAQQDGASTTLDAYIWPEGMRVDNAWVLIDGRRVVRKTLSIPVGPHGASPTYGLTIRGEDNDGTPTITALLIAGVSGQFTEFDDEDEVLDILAQLARHDAD